MTHLLQVLVSGLALGSLYALIALGFVIVYRATGVVNFAQGSFVMLGAYMTFELHRVQGLPFAAAAAICAIAGAVLGAGVDRLVMRKLVGRSHLTAIMVTIGVLYIVDELVIVIWGPDNLSMGDPWGVRTVTLGGVVVAVKDIWMLLITLVVLAVVFSIFRFTRTGLAMRASAIDLEAAAGQGISPTRMSSIAWALGVAVAVAAGVMAGSGAAQVQPGLGHIALAAFPAIILGGIESPVGAVLGGLVIGVLQQLVAGYEHQYFAWAGTNFSVLAPYVVMTVVLLVRPQGLFGVIETRRV